MIYERMYLAYRFGATLGPSLTDVNHDSFGVLFFFFLFFHVLEAYCNVIVIGVS